MIPDYNSIVSFTLCYEDLEFSEENGLIYKDLALLAYNRTSHFIEHVSEDEKGEIMVIDIGKAEDCSDSKYVTFFQGRVFDGHINYTNLQFINDALK